MNKQLKPKWLCIFSHAWHFGWCPQFRPSTHSLGSPPSHPHPYPTLTAYMAALLIGRLAALCSADAVMMCCYSVAALLLFCCCDCSAVLLFMTRMTRMTTAATTIFSDAPLCPSISRLYLLVPYMATSLTGFAPPNRFCTHSKSKFRTTGLTSAHSPPIPGLAFRRCLLFWLVFRGCFC